MASLLYKIGRFSYRKWWVVIAVWIVAAVGIGVLGSSVSKPFKDDFELPGSDAVAAQEVIQKEFPDAAATDVATVSVVFAAKNGERLDAGDNAKAVTAVVAKLQEIPQLTEKQRAAILDPTTGPMAAETLSKDGKVAVLKFAIDAKTPPGKPAPSHDTIETVTDAKDVGRDAGLTVETAGAANEEIAEPPAELIGIGVAVVVMVVTFAALLSALMPLTAALVGIAISTSIIAIGTSFLTLGTSTTGLSTMIGLAVGIDYSLFVISRYRDETTRTDDRAHAAGIAVGTAGSAVIFAGATVVIALAALSLTGMSFLTQMGLGAAVTVVLAVLVSLTVLPAMLGLFKSWAFKPRIPVLWTPEAVKTRRTMGDRVGFEITKRPLPYIIGAIAVLALAAIPIGQLQLGLDGATQSDKAALKLERDAFGAGKSSPLIAVVAADDPAGLKTAAAQFAAETKGLDHIAADGFIGPIPNASGTAAQFVIVPDSGPSTPETSDLLDEVRDKADDVAEGTGVFAGVGGEAAINADFSDTLTGKLPLYLVVVVGLAFILLTIVFRSVVIPLIASLGFLLSIAATFGVTVGIFQNGWLGWIPPEDQGPILVFMPIFLIGIVFGLAMDYQVFLVSRMREEHHHGASPHEAIRTGYRAGARVITAAAVIMISVFAGFTLSTETLLKLLGFSMAAAIVFDAFLVRMILMPASMALLGEKAWWMPRWLDRVLPSIDVEGENLRAASEPEKEAVPATVS